MRAGGAVPGRTAVADSPACSRSESSAPPLSTSPPRPARHRPGTRQAAARSNAPTQRSAAGAGAATAGNSGRCGPRPPAGRSAGGSSRRPPPSVPGDQQQELALPRARGHPAGRTTRRIRTGTATDPAHSPGGIPAEFRTALSGPVLPAIHYESCDGIRQASPTNRQFEGHPDDPRRPRGPPYALLPADGTANTHSDRTRTGPATVPVPVQSPAPHTCRHPPGRHRDQAAGGSAPPVHRHVGPIPRARAGGRRPVPPGFCTGAPTLAWAAHTSPAQTQRCPQPDVRVRRASDASLPPTVERPQPRLADCGHPLQGVRVRLPRRLDRIRRPWRQQVVRLPALRQASACSPPPPCAAGDHPGHRPGALRALPVAAARRAHPQPAPDSVGQIPGDLPEDPGSGTCSSETGAAVRTGLMRSTSRSTSGSRPVPIGLSC